MRWRRLDASGYTGQTTASEFPRAGAPALLVPGATTVGQDARPTAGVTTQTGLHIHDVSLASVLQSRATSSLGRIQPQDAQGTAQLRDMRDCGGAAAAGHLQPRDTAATAGLLRGCCCEASQATPQLRLAFHAALQIRVPMSRRPPAPLYSSTGGAGISTSGIRELSSPP